MAYNILIKKIIQVISKIFLFIVSMFALFQIFGIVLPIIIAPFMWLFSKSLVLLVNNDTLFGNIELVFAFFIISVVLTIQCTLFFGLKIFKIFDYIDRIKIVFPLINVLVVMSILFCVSDLYLTFHGIDMKTIPQKFWKFDGWSVLVFIYVPPFLAYKFLKFLAKILPAKFEKFDYYTSIEFIKDFEQNTGNYCSSTCETSRIVKLLFEYCIRTIIFLLLSALLISTVITLYSYSQNILAEDILLVDNVNQQGHWALYLLELVVIYLIAKLCGIFKQIKNLNFFLALWIVLCINTIYSLYQLYGTSSELANNDKYFLLLLGSFFLHRFFNFLAKKFPVPFGVIGYYTSIKPWKKLWQKVQFKNLS